MAKQSLSPGRRRSAIERRLTIMAPYRAQGKEGRMQNTPTPTHGYGKSYTVEPTGMVEPKGASRMGRGFQSRMKSKTTRSQMDAEPVQKPGSEGEKRLNAKLQEEARY